MIRDITFCVNYECPLKKACKRNPHNITGLTPVSMVKFHYERTDDGQAHCKSFMQKS